MRVQASQNLRFSGYKNVFSKCFLEPLDSLAKGQGMKGGHFLHTGRSVLMLGDWSVLAPEQGLPYYDTDRNEAQSLAAPCNLF